MAEREKEDAEEAWLQLRPVEPLPSQCCGSGCSPCVFDLYHRDLARWEAAHASNDRSLLSGKQPQVSRLLFKLEGHGGSLYLVWVPEKQMSLPEAGTLGTKSRPETLCGCSQSLLT